MGSFTTVINENPIPESYNVAPVGKKVESIMKMQEQIVAMENKPNFIKVTVDETPLHKFNYTARLNIV